MDKKWNISHDSIKSPKAKDFDEKWRRSYSTMAQRTSNHHLFGRISHNQSLFEKKKNNVFSEGSTQAAKRKMRAQTIQRIPDGKLITQYDKNSLEQAQLEYIFENKVLSSEFDGKDMLKNLWKTYNSAYDYCFGCVLTGFERDRDGDPRISYTQIRYSDVFPDPDCDYIEEAEWYFIRSYVSMATLEGLLSDEGIVSDPTFNQDTVRFLVENKYSDAQVGDSVALADVKKGVRKTESVEVRTLYQRGAKEFVSYVPSVQAVLRTTKNYDPRLDVPLHFLILEPDPDFPLGVSQIMWTIAQQQFADAFQSLAYETLLRATRPPLKVFGNLPNPKLSMRPEALWAMGTNPNNNIEPFPVETTTLNNYGTILEQIRGSMMTTLGTLDGTTASDAQQNYSGTPQGVEAQREDRTINVNQMQKRVEIFFAEWANHALRSYVNSLSGKKWLVANEDSRRKIFDIVGEGEAGNYIDGNKILIDFSTLQSEAIEFRVRTGSLIQNRQQEQIDNIQSVLIPLSQMLGNLSEENHSLFENQVLLPLIQSWLEKADIDVSASTSDAIGEQIITNALMATMDAVKGQQEQLDHQGAIQEQMLGAMPPEQAEAIQQGMDQIQPPAESMGEEIDPMQGQVPMGGGMPPMTEAPLAGGGPEMPIDSEPPMAPPEEMF